MEPGWQKSNWGAPANTKQTILCQLTARNAMSDSSQRHESQIWTDLRHFISVWRLREARKTGCVECNFFFFFNMRFRTALCTNFSFKATEDKMKKKASLPYMWGPLWELHFIVYSQIVHRKKEFQICFYRAIADMPHKRNKSKYVFLASGQRKASFSFLLKGDTCQCNGRFIYTLGVGLTKSKASLTHVGNYLKTSISRLFTKQ